MDIKLFEEKKVRIHFDADKEKWYFSIVDVVSLLTNQPHIKAQGTIGRL